jgi:signal transduction histidine kinase
VLLRDSDQERVNETEQARHDERIAIARELHDVVAHHVTGIVVQAQAAQLVADSRPEVALAALASIEHAGSEALVAMRRMVGALRDENADAPISPTASIRDLHDLAARSTALGLPVRLALDEPDEPDERGVMPSPLPIELSVSVHRIVREALTNARQHAVDATVVDVSVHRAGGHLDVIIHDDGRHVRGERRGGGFGLVGMAERVNALGGLFVAGPVADGGWQVHARLPIAGRPGAVGTRAEATA